MTASPAPPTPLRSVSYGGGVQSTALLVLAAHRVIDFPLFLFSNVGEQSEDPDTLAYVREVAIPYGREHGIEVVEIHKRDRAGEIVDLWDRLTREGSRSLPIPVRMSNGAPGTRSCTAEWKIRVVGKELRRRGASPDNIATVAIGISTDEWTRANNRRTEPYEEVVYPLLDVDRAAIAAAGLADLGPGIGLNRSGCMEVIRSAGIPVPGKSSCYFCPFHRPLVWKEMARERPHLFDKAVELEDLLNRRREMLGKDHVYLTRFGKPLRVVVGTDEQQAFDLDMDEGYRCGDVCDT